MSVPPARTSLVSKNIPVQIWRDIYKFVSTNVGEIYKVSLQTLERYMFLQTRYIMYI